MQPSLFRLPFDAASSDDVQALLGWPETTTVEFKETLSRKDGKPDGWMSGSTHLDPYARDKLFKEIIAFANTAGGHLILGIEESDEKPSVAKAIKLIPRCIDLAERLEHAAQSIDPVIPNLLIRGIELDFDKNGIVVFRVPQSRLAPHRGLDKECYMRHGTSSIPMTMREIHDAVYMSQRINSLVEAEFISARLRQQRWLEKSLINDRKLCWFRITLVPIGGLVVLPRLRQESTPPELRQHYPIKSGGKSAQAYALFVPAICSPIVRGRRWSTGRHDADPAFLEQLQNGVVSLGFHHEIDREAFTPSWVVGHLINVLNVVDSTRFLAGVPDLEYALEFELGFQPEGLKVALTSFDDYDFQDVGSFDTDLILLPRLMYGPTLSREQLINALLLDLCDAAGALCSLGIELS